MKQVKKWLVNLNLTKLLIDLFFLFQESFLES